MLCAGDTYAVDGTTCEACPADHTCAEGLATPRPRGLLDVVPPAALYGGAAALALLLLAGVGTALACRARRRRANDRACEMLHL